MCTAVYNATTLKTNENRPMSEAIDKGRRQLLTAATTLTGAVGVAFAAVPFLASWKPSARAKALGAPVEIDISKLEPGAMLKIEWRGKPVLVVRRTQEMIERIGANDDRLSGSGLREVAASRTMRRIRRARSGPNSS